MSEAVQSVSVTCPFCFEAIEIVIDATAGDEQTFVYDCEVCCRPLELRVKCDARGVIAMNVDRAYD